MIKLDRWKIISMIFGGVGIIALFFGINNFLAGRISELSQKISGGLTLLPNCGFTEEKSVHVKGILLEALKQLQVENNPDSARTLRFRED
jgi:hypothetical protein